MARTRSPDFEEKRAFIRDRCAHLFAAKGYANTSLGDIAEECDMVKSAVYHYHKSKEAMLMAIVLGHIEDVRVGTEKALAKGTTPQERFEILVSTLIDIYTRFREQQTVLNNDRYFLSRQSKRKVHTAEKKLIDMTAEVISQVNPRLKNAAEVRNVVTMLFFGMVNWTYTWYRSDGPIKPADLAALISQICLGGIRSTDPALVEGNRPKAAPASTIEVEQP
jgi:AcrR family transcriptional regulator